MNNVVINVTQVVRTVEVNATPNLITITVNQSSGGSGAVSSVFGRSGSVTAQNGDYNAEQISETAGRVFVSPTEKSQIAHANRSVLDLISEAFTTALKNLYDAAAEAIASHIVDTDNPHNTTASQVGAYTTTEVDNLIPNLNGGTPGQILAKNSATDKDWSWIDNFTEDVRATVKATEAILKGQAVYISGANGTNQLITKADYAAEATSSQTIGIAFQDFATNDIGQIITYGKLAGINTNSGNAGDAVYLGANGALIFGVANKPVAPNHLVYIGDITRKSSTNGEIFVKVQNGYELEELHNVTASDYTTPLNTDSLFVFNASASLWKRLTLANLKANLKAYFDTLYTSSTAVDNQVYTGTPVWTGTTAPSGAADHSYSWSRIGNLVTLRLNLVYEVGGSALTAVTIPLPTDCPAPYVASGGGPSNNRVICVGSGIMQTNFSVSTLTTYVLLKTNSTNTGFDIIAQRASNTYRMVTVMVTYLTT